MHSSCNTHNLKITTWSSKMQEYNQSSSLQENVVILTQKAKIHDTCVK
jgi:hypothetical protein